jgi:hypothetical protein
VNDGELAAPPLQTTSLLARSGKQGRFVRFYGVVGV